MSQVSVAGGENVTLGLEPMLTSCMGAGVPQTALSRMGGAGSATTSRPLRRAAQRTRPSSMSLADHSCGCADGSLGVPGVSTIGQPPSAWEDIGGLPAAEAGADCCAEATGESADMAVSAHAIAAQRVIGIRNTYP